MVLDNASTDGTERFVADLPLTMRSRLPVSVRLQAANLGVAVGRQLLANNADGEIFLFLDSDVVITEDRWLAQLLEPFTDEAVGVVGTAGSMVTFPEQGEARPAPTQFLPSGAGKCDVVSGWCMAVRAGLFQHVAFDVERFSPRWEEDADLCLQVRACGYDVVQATVTGIEHQPGNDGAADVDRQESLRKFREKWQGKGVIKMEGGYRA